MTRESRAMTVAGRAVLAAVVGASAAAILVLLTLLPIQDARPALVHAVVAALVPALFAGVLGAVRHERPSGRVLLVVVLWAFGAAGGGVVAAHLLVRRASADPLVAGAVVTGVAAALGAYAVLHVVRADPPLRRVVPLAAVVIAASLVAPTVAVAATPAPPTLIDFLRSSRFRASEQVVVGGLGSSVGAGATLPDPTTQAPVAVFTQDLRQRVDPRGKHEWTVLNASVNGSTIHDGLATAWPELAKQHPDVVVLAYGMNDGAPAQFNSGETFPGAMRELGTLVEEIRRSGAIPVILTSPHPDPDRFDFDQPVNPVIYPAPGQTLSPALQRGTEEVAVAGRRITVSSRHAAVNAGMRELARQEGVDVVDVEPAWYRAVAASGDPALFDDGEFVHPNLRGHRQSYGVAIAHWIAALPAAGG